MLDYIIRKVKVFYSTSPVFSSLTKKISNSRIYFGLVKKLIDYQKNKAGPFNLVIETSSICNAKCLMCPYQIMKRKKKIMSNKVFNKIVSRIKKEKLPINKIFISGMGEPLTDPKFFKRVKVLKNLAPIRLYTNASLMNPEEIIASGVDEINISFNGENKSDYQKIMGLNYSKTIKNINRLISLRKKDKPFIQISMIAVGENEMGIKKFLTKWQGKVNSVTISRAHTWGGKININSKFMVQNTRFTYPCRSLWHTFMIDSNGSFVICCRDYESHNILGNILNDSFSKIRKSLLLKKFQKTHFKFSRKDLPKMCQNCNFPYQDGVEWFMPRNLD